uniref:Uncharacterized protein n=1 Tax=Anguilla anguilla TaxID=7936 RepID=A0A0E9WTQ7_ANGAN
MPKGKQSVFTELTGSQQVLVEAALSSKIYPTGSAFCKLLVLCDKCLVLLESQCHGEQVGVFGDVV